MHQIVKVHKEKLVLLVHKELLGLRVLMERKVHRERLVLQEPRVLLGLMVQTEQMELKAHKAQRDQMA